MSDPYQLPLADWADFVSDQAIEERLERARDLEWEAQQAFRMSQMDSEEEAAFQCHNQTKE